MRLLVCGGRDYHDSVSLGMKLADLDDKSDNRISMIITGGATGADYLAYRWALSHGVQTVVCEANWKIHGKRAGWIRNVSMADLQPDLVVAFTGGRGTAMMIEIANDRKIPVIQCT